MQNRFARSITALAGPLRSFGRESGQSARFVDEENDKAGRAGFGLLQIPGFEPVLLEVLNEVRRGVRCGRCVVVVSVSRNLSFLLVLTLAISEVDLDLNDESRSPLCGRDELRPGDCLGIRALGRKS